MTIRVYAVLIPRNIRHLNDVKLKVTSPPLYRQKKTFIIINVNCLNIKYIAQCYYTIIYGTAWSD